MDIKILYDRIGDDFSCIPDNLRCATPVFLLYGDKAKVKISDYQYINDPDYFLPIIQKYFTEVSESEADLRAGDVIITKVKNDLTQQIIHHFGVYAADGYYFHLHRTLMLSRISMHRSIILSCWRFKA